MLRMKWIKKKQKIIEEKIKANELLQSYDKEKKGIKQSRRVWKENKENRRGNKETVWMLINIRIQEYINSL